MIRITTLNGEWHDFATTVALRQYATRYPIGCHGWTYGDPAVWSVTLFRNPATDKDNPWLVQQGRSTIGGSFETCLSHLISFIYGYEQGRYGPSVLPDGSFRALDVSVVPLLHEGVRIYDFDPSRQDAVVLTDPAGGDEFLIMRETFDTYQQAGFLVALPPENGTPCYEFTEGALYHLRRALDQFNAVLLNKEAI